MSDLFAPSTPPPPSAVLVDPTPDHQRVNTLLNDIRHTCDKLAIPAGRWSTEARVLSVCRPVALDG